MKWNRRLKFEQLESRYHTAIASFYVNLLSDSDGMPGDTILDDTVQVGQPFFVEIMAREYHPLTSGLGGVSLDINWDPRVLSEIDIPNDGEFDASAIVTDALPLLRGGAVDHSSGTIDNIRGAVFLSAGVGRTIGNWRPERFALFHFQANAVGSSPFFMHEGRSQITTVPVKNLTSASIEFELQTITVVDTPFMGPLPADEYFASLPEPASQECLS